MHLHRNSQKAAVTTLCTLWCDRNTVHTSTTLALFSGQECVGYSYDQLTRPTHRNGRFLFWGLKFGSYGNIYKKKN